MGTTEQTEADFELSLDYLYGKERTAEQESSPDYWADDYEPGDRWGDPEDGDGDCYWINY